MGRGAPGRYPLTVWRAGAPGPLGGQAGSAHPVFMSSAAPPTPSCAVLKGTSSNQGSRGSTSTAYQR